MAAAQTPATPKATKARSAEVSGAKAGSTSEVSSAKISNTRMAETAEMAEIAWTPAKACHEGGRGGGVLRAKVQVRAGTGCVIRVIVIGSTVRVVVIDPGTGVIGSG